ncbi:uncharacterized protein F5147DRAFT_648586 [Suillus discolor]|uniref:ABC transporter domain-containing protein n=1 Tax=Suillus discolor TaxID=1912936 RepID=A0A9P7K077_9AGAM|nr:uncharacterized protein F5147DRAFT_648586 [Suillus discolor]KAG2118221.1 hypothetical protein F5147DRAFT_648586 [Suillus discolor]
MKTSPKVDERLKILGKRLSNKLLVIVQQQTEAPSLSSRFHGPTFIALMTQTSQRRSSVMLNGLLTRDWLEAKDSPLADCALDTPRSPTHNPSSTLTWRTTPFLSDPPRDPHNCVAFVSFAHRSRGVKEEDRITLRESMLGEYDFLNIQPKGGKVKTPVEIAQDEVKRGIFRDLTSRLGLSSPLDLPLIALSTGQTRRARIVKAILSEPELLVLDEPLSIKDEIMSKHAEHHANAKEAGHSMASTTQSYLQSGLDHGKPVVDMKNVLKNINWTIREGQRWHLQGANGSGKTTLFSLLTGDHPQSYTQRDDSNLELFSRPRQRIPTPLLRSLIGIVSPELANAYLRHADVSVFDVVGTGFDGGFILGGKDGVGIGLEGALSDEVRQ